MKKMIPLAIALTVLLTLTTASAQEPNRVSGSAEVQGFFENGKGGTATYVDNFTSVTITPKFGAFVFGQSSRAFSQIYAGPTYAPIGGIQVGIGAGVQQVAPNWRVGGFVFAKKGRVSNLLIIEEGGDGSWYKNIFSVKASGRLAVGALAQRHLGVGPRIEVPLAKHVALWGAATRDLEAHRNKATLALSFSY